MGVDEWLEQADLQDRARLLAGRDFWSLDGVEALGVPSIVLTDGPHGVRMQRTSEGELSLADSHPSTCFPTAASLASTWDPVLVERVGDALGIEARALGVSVLLGPGANIKRSPLCGRNFEYFSEDPLVSSSTAAAWIRGVQGQGVGASLKHYAANNQERLRYSVDALVDERALREIYLASFEAAVRDARPLTVMSAYNRVNGSYATESAWLIETVLRGEWGFDGVVMSDWGAVSDRVAALAAGLDLQMPGLPGVDGSTIVFGVEDGRLAEADVDRSVRRILDLVSRTEAARTPVAVDVDAHHALAEEVAAAGSVLLKNDGDLLPLSPGVSVAVIGAFAVEPRFQGAGSSTVNARRVVSALEAIDARVSSLTYVPGYHRRGDVMDNALLDQARAVAVAADVAIVLVGLPEAYETEGADRQHMRLPAAHDALVEVVAAANPRTVVVLSNGSPVEMPWAERVPTILEGYLGGQESGGAIARVLFGELEPGGRLAETFPVSWLDHPVQQLPDGPRFSEYRESVYVGYRWFDTVRGEVLFPFGHGLGYTTFAYSDVRVDRSDVASGEELVVSVTVTNTGARRGSDVVQVYVRPPAGAPMRPAHELRAFAKTTLEPGESRTIELTLPARAFQRWSPSAAGWVVDPGEHTVEVGASSRDIRGTATVTVAGAAVDDVVPEAYRRITRRTTFERDPFVELYGRPIGANVAETKGEFTVDTPLAFLGTSPTAVRLRALVAGQLGKQIGEDEASQMTVRQTLDDAPLRLLQMFSMGRLSGDAVDLAVMVANGERAEVLREWRERRRTRRRRSS